MNNFILDDSDELGWPSGKGFFDTINKVIDYLPSSDSTARTAFPGERHAILRLPNGRYGRANYAGPGTNIAARVMRKDPPRTAIDAESEAHDIRYDLAQSDSDYDKADKKYVEVADRLERTKKDSAFNTRLARTGIEGKMFAEKVGLYKYRPAKTTTSETEKQAMKTELSKLESQGYGYKEPTADWSWFNNAAAKGHPGGPEIDDKEVSEHDPLKSFRKQVLVALKKPAKK